VAGSSEHGSEFSGSIKGKINSEQMSDCQFLKCTLLHGVCYLSADAYRGSRGSEK
jgi:hypothetical protein